MAKIALLTTFQEFNPGYSLTGIVKDQAKMLKRHGNEVFLFVNERYKGEEFSDDVNLVKRVPFTHLIDYDSRKKITDTHVGIAEATAKALTEAFDEYGIDFVFTHDWLLTGWNLPYAFGIQKMATKIPWLHWLHSIPSIERDWCILPEFGANHFLVYPNATDRVRVAECFRTNINQVRVIPHIKDLRTFFDFRPETCNIIDQFPALMQSKIIQIYPAAGDRLPHKRVREVINFFGKMQTLGVSVCLFIANQWSTHKKHSEEVDDYLSYGEVCGLKPGSNLIFSSTINNGMYKKRVPQEILRELMMLGNIFIYPTTHESFGLVLPEASLASGAFCILNKSLHMQMEVSGMNAIYFDFGSYTTNLPPDHNWDEYLRQIALIALGRMQQNDALMTRTFMRMTYNMDEIYLKYYAPIMSESRLTVV